MTNEKLDFSGNLAKELKKEVIDENVLLLELEVLLKDSLILKDITRGKNALTLCFNNGQNFEISVNRI
ncbi:MAG: hypothetical protein K2N33_02830 [Clostridia bacterium]|nr:hypothetical protein [Clostridia bacterium]MDE7306304.1 hypothetical protein [Clostridia bacterium]